MRDSDVRTAILEMLERQHLGDVHTRIVEEMGIWSGSVRIDIAVINGELRGYELKSDRDTLSRLPVQADIYSRVFDRVDLVVGLKHAEKAVKLVPFWWGVLTAEVVRDSIKIVRRRRAKLNPAPDCVLIAQLLWRDEVLAVLDEFGLATGWRSKKVRLLHERLATGVPMRDLKARVREKLKARTNWLGQLSTNQLDMPIDSQLNPSL